MYLIGSWKFGGTYIQYYSYVEARLKTIREEKERAVRSFEIAKRLLTEESVSNLEAGVFII